MKVMKSTTGERLSPTLEEHKVTSVTTGGSPNFTGVLCSWTDSKNSFWDCSFY